MNVFVELLLEFCSVCIYCGIIHDLSPSSWFLGKFKEQTRLSSVIMLQRHHYTIYTRAHMCVCDSDPLQ